MHQQHNSAWIMAIAFTNLFSTVHGSHEFATAPIFSNGRDHFTCKGYAHVNDWHLHLPACCLYPGDVFCTFRVADDRGIGMGVVLGLVHWLATRSYGVDGGGGSRSGLSGGGGAGRRYVMERRSSSASGTRAIRPRARRRISLTLAERKALAEYFSKLPIPAALAKPATSPPPADSVGAQLATRGRRYSRCPVANSAMHPAAWELVEFPAARRAICHLHRQPGQGVEAGYASQRSS